MYWAVSDEEVGEEGGRKQGNKEIVIIICIYSQNVGTASIVGVSVYSNFIFFALNFCRKYP